MTFSSCMHNIFNKFFLQFHFYHIVAEKLHHLMRVNRSNCDYYCSCCTWVRIYKKNVVAFTEHRYGNEIFSLQICSGFIQDDWRLLNLLPVKKIFFFPFKERYQFSYWPNNILITNFTDFIFPMDLFNFCTYTKMYGEEKTYKPLRKNLPHHTFITQSITLWLVYTWRFSIKIYFPFNRILCTKLKRHGKSLCKIDVGFRKKRKKKKILFIIQGHTHLQQPYTVQHYISQVKICT